MTRLIKKEDKMAKPTIYYSLIIVAIAFVMTWEKANKDIIEMTERLTTHIWR